MTLPERLESARGGAAVGPPEERGVLGVQGKQARDFLNRMSTQDLAALATGASTHAAFLDARGHLVSDAVVKARESEIVLLTEKEAAPLLGGHLRRFILRDDVRIEDRSASLACLPVLGERGVALARERAGAAAVEDPRRGAPALDLLLPPGEAAASRQALIAAGAVDLGAQDLEALRILAGIPRFGVGADMEAGRLVMEAALSGSAIHFGKGCYIGQEVVLRGTFRGRIQKGLVQLDLPAGAGPGAPLRSGEDEVGRVTSAAETPEGRIGLGYLRRAFWPPGTRLATQGGEARVRRALVEERD